MERSGTLGADMNRRPALKERQMLGVFFARALGWESDRLDTRSPVYKRLPLFQSTSLGLRHLLRERNFASGVVCDAMASGRAPAEAKTENAVVFCKARFRARFLWFCGESIGEARVRSLRLSR